MSERLPAQVDPDAPLFVVSVAAQLAGMHPQTLRGYDRLGLVVPRRARGRGRRYSLRDIAKLRHIQHLSQDEGINLEGIRRILSLENELETLRTQVAQLGDLMQTIQASTPDPRVFTASQYGDIHLGRTARLRIQRAITRA
jgi:MerR family transcriptional regulator/heat shock protein HspR